MTAVSLRVDLGVSKETDWISLERLCRRYDRPDDAKGQVALRDVFRRAGVPVRSVAGRRRVYIDDVVAYEARCRKGISARGHGLALRRGKSVISSERAAS